MKSEIVKAIEQNKIIAIVRGANPQQAVNLAKAIYEGGIKLIEVTFNQKKPQSFMDTVIAIAQIKKACPDMIVGAGTVLSVEQVDLAIGAGAEYVVSPDTDEEVIKYARQKGLVTLPGAYTASEAKKAHNAGADFVKLFPCVDASYLKALTAPLSHIKFLAVGGVNVDNAGEFIKAGAVGVGVGSSLVNKQSLENGEYGKITQLAKKMVNNVKDI